jgi:hypothetical protein
MDRKHSKQVDLTSSQINSIFSRLGKRVSDHEHRLTIVDLLEISHDESQGVVGECQIGLLVN